MAQESVLKRQPRTLAGRGRGLRRIPAWVVARAREITAPGLAAGLITVGFVGLSLWWVLVDQRVADGDQARHLSMAFYFFNELKVGHELVPFRFEAPAGAIYPPLLYEVGVLGLLIGGQSTDSPVIAVDLVFIPLLATAVYRSGRLTHDRLTGVLALVFAFGGPMLISQSHLFMLDVPLTAMVAAGAWLMLESDRFERLGFCLAAGVVVGLGMLLKQPYAFYLLPCGLVMLLRGGYRNWKNLALMLGVAVAIAIPWYLEHWDRLRTVATEATAQVDNPFGSEAPRFSLENFSWYGWNLVNQQLLLPLALLFVGGSVAAALRWARARRADDYAPELLAGAFGGMLAVALWFGYHDPRYTLPTTLFVAILATGWIARSRRAVRLGAAAALAAIVAVNTIAVNSGSLGQLQLDLPGKEPKTVAVENKLDVVRSFGYVVGRPEEWGDILALMKAARRDGVREVAWEDAAPISMNPGGLGLYANLSGVKAEPDPGGLRRDGIFLVARTVVPGLPPPCGRLDGDNGLYVFRGAPGPADPARAKNLYCPRHRG